MYEIYEKLKVSLGDEARFFALVRNWLDMEAPNPFEKGTKAGDLYLQAMLHHGNWRAGRINGRSGRVKMVDAIRKIVEMGTPNPYANHVLGVLPVETPAEPEEESTIETADVTQDDAHVFGVVPELGIIEAVAEVPLVNTAAPEEIKQAEEKVEESKKKKYFNRHKE